MKFWILVLAFKASAAMAAVCTAGMSLQTICDCRISALHPTQIAVGLREVRDKERKLSQMLQAGNLPSYLKKNPEPVVLAPGSQIFIIDHHHLARALSDLGVKDTFCQIQEDFSQMSEVDFWSHMIHNDWVYLSDENGVGPQPVSRLPESVSEMKDDPYRSLAKAVEKAGGFDETSILYAEFKWADFFRTRIRVGTSDAEFADAVRAGVDLAQSMEARGLPGYHGN